MSFKVLSWNIEHFKGLSDPRATDLAAYIKGSGLNPPSNDPPDIIAIYEVENSHQGFLFALTHFKNYLTFITEGQNSQEIMILVKKDAFDHITITQNHIFKIGNPYLRPGALLTVSKNNVHTNLLFLHSASGILSDAFGDRIEIAGHFFNLNRQLQKIEDDGGTAARLIILGDLNTMGLRFPRNLVSQKILSYGEERDGLAQLAARAHQSGFTGMEFAVKKHDLTFSNPNDRDQSNLDHVIISDGIHLTNLGNRPDDNAAFKVSVNGWIDKPSGPDRNNFINSMSDHCSLFFKVQ